MRKLKLILLGLLILFPAISQAAAPSRPFNYVAHTTIDPAQNNSNENTLYSYLQAGVDTYSSGSITNDAISAIAAISYSKLNLLGSIATADLSPSIVIPGSNLNLTSPGPIGSTAPNTGTFTDLTASGTIKFGTIHQGDIFYDNGTSIVRLTPGTSGQFLKTLGASANPLWANAGSYSSQIFTTSGTFTAPSGITRIFISGCGAGGAGGGSVNPGDAGGGGGAGEWIINQPYIVIPSNSYTVTIGSGGTPVNAAGNTPGNTGGSTIFDTITLVGGNGGVGADTSGAHNGGSGGFTSTTGSSLNASASVSTTATAGAIGINRQTGGNGAKGSTSGNGVGGGGGATPFGTAPTGIGGTGTAATANTCAGGAGAGATGGGGFPTGGGIGGSGIIVVQY